MVLDGDRNLEWELSVRDKALVVDLDGTLLTPSNDIDNIDQTLIHKLVPYVKISIASGRYKQDVLYYAQRLRLTALQISDNGARLFDPVSGVDIHARAIDEDVCRRLFSHPLLSNLRFYCCSNGKTLSSDDLGTAREVSGVTIVSTMADTLSQAQSIAACITEELDITAEISRGSQDEWYIVCTAKGVNKGYGLRQFAKYTGVDLKNVCAIGDGLNDLALFDVAGYSIAMGNAPQEVKDAADSLTSDRSKRGFSLAVSAWLKCA